MGSTFTFESMLRSSHAQGDLRLGSWPSDDFASPVPQVKDPNIQGGQMYVSLPLTDGEVAVIRSIINVRTSTRTVNPQNSVDA